MILQFFSFQWLIPKNHSRWFHQFPSLDPRPSRWWRDLHVRSPRHAGPEKSMDIPMKHGGIHLCIMGTSWGSFPLGMKPWSPKILGIGMALIFWGFGWTKMGMWEHHGDQTWLPGTSYLQNNYMVNFPANHGWLHRRGTGFTHQETMDCCSILGIHGFS